MVNEIIDFSCLIDIQLFLAYLTTINKHTTPLI